MILSHISGATRLLVRVLAPARVVLLSGYSNLAPRTCGGSKQEKKPSQCPALKVQTFSS